MNMARFYLSCELLREVLCLPRGTDIRFIKMAEHQTIEITVTHPDLKESAASVAIEGYAPPLISPSFRTEYQKVAVFQEWGQL